MSLGQPNQGQFQTQDRLLVIDLGSRGCFVCLGNFWKKNKKNYQKKYRETPEKYVNNIIENLVTKDDQISWMKCPQFVRKNPKDKIFKRYVNKTVKKMFNRIPSDVSKRVPKNGEKNVKECPAIKQKECQKM